MKNLRDIFNPIYNAIINIAAYSLLGVLFSLLLNESGFLNAGIFICVTVFAVYVLYLKNFQQTTRTQHLAFLVITISALLLMLVYYALAIKRSPYFFLILALASLSPLYNFCGFVRFTQVDEKTSLLEYILGIMLVPFVAFLVYNHYSGTNYKTIYFIVIVAAYYFVIFALIKIAVSVAKEKSLVRNLMQSPGAKQKFTFFFAIVMPVTGLILNQYAYSYVSQYAKQTGYTFTHMNDGIFGDFSHPIFYALTVINGAALLARMEKYKKLRLPLFYIRAVGFSFIVYMFIVFLPVLPIGVLTLFFIVGIYAFVPLLIVRIQWKILFADIRLLKDSYKRKWVACVFILGFLTLPTLLAVSFAYDKANFDKARVYADVYNTDTSGVIDIDALARTLNSRKAYTTKMRLYNSTIRTYYSYRNIPIISGIYKLFIFGGQELDWQFQRTLEALFFNEGYYNYTDYSSNLDILDYYNRDKSPVRLLKASHSTEYDDSIQAYRTRVDLVLRNSMSFKNEYTTVFYMPDGAFVSDYYLYVGDEKKPGLLTDRRAALTIYKSIVLRQLDPGILHYLDDNLLELRVFPFMPNEIRRTGFELIHKNGLEFEIDGKVIKTDGDSSLSELALPNAVLLSAEEINGLPPLNRELDYYFILDCSEDSDTDKLSGIIDMYCRVNEIESGTLYLTNYRFEKHDVKDINKLKFTNEGGFNLNLAVRDIFKNAGKDSIPVIIYVTENEGYKIIKPQKIKNYNSPETEFYYRLVDYNLMLTPYSLFTNYEFDPETEPIIQNAVSYNGYAVIKDGTDKLVILDETVPEPTGNQYLDALSLTSENRINKKNGIKNPVSHIRKSFLSHVLTPSTAFIVVETQEQEDALLKLQENILNSQEAQESVSLSEPGIAGMAILICLIIFLTKISAHIRMYHKTRIVRK